MHAVGERVRWKGSQQWVERRPLEYVVVAEKGDDACPSVKIDLTRRSGPLHCLAVTTIYEQCLTTFVVGYVFYWCLVL